MLLLQASAALIAASSLVVAAPTAQLYLSPSPKTSHKHQITLTAPQANAVLVHHLGISQFEHYPQSTSNAPQDHAWEQLISASSLESTREDAPKMVIMLECPSSGCADLIPQSLADHEHYDLPSLPTQSWLSLVTLQLYRLSSSLGLDVSDKSQVWGLDSFVTTIKSIAGWMGWVGHELGSAIGWSELKDSFNAAVEKGRKSSGLLTDLDFFSSSKFVDELESLASLVDSFSYRARDDGPQSSATQQVIAVHLKHVSSVAVAERAKAQELAKATLDAALMAFRKAQPQGQIILVALPPYSPPLLRKRKAWLKPFSLVSRYSSHSQGKRGPHPSQALNKRQYGTEEVEELEDEGRNYPLVAAKATPTPVVPSSSICFSSADDVNNQTANCLGHGVPVKGVTVKGGECWVCSCQPTEVDGKVTRWGGQGCEKEDLSGDFNLLFFSGLGLVVILAASVFLLAGVGSQELPGTLSSVSGAGSHAHRD